MVNRLFTHDGNGGFGVGGSYVFQDLSRLSRDYVEADILIERLFVQMNVRFISLHERIDSYNGLGSVSSMVVLITNVMND